MGKKINSNTNSKAVGQSKTKARKTPLAVNMKNTASQKAKKTSSGKLLSKPTTKVIGSSKPTLNKLKSKKSTTSSGSAVSQSQKQQPLKTATNKINNSNPKSSLKSAKGNGKVNSVPPRQNSGNDNSLMNGALQPKPTSDKSLLNVSHDIRIHGFSSLSDAVQKSTPKVKHLLLHECDLIMECRFCRNLFRSLPNFISHKQNYCKSIFHQTSGCSQFIGNSTNSSPEINLQYYIAASPNKDILIPGNGSGSMQDNTSSAKNDISVQIEDNQTRSVTTFYKNIQEFNEERAIDGENGDYLETMKLSLDPVRGRTDSIMFQSKMETDKSVCDSSNNVFDNREVLSRDTAILGPDGKVICTGTTRGIEKIVRHLTAQIDFAQQKMMQQSTSQFPEMCDICKTVFNTEKAFRQHRRNAPDCLKQSSSKSFEEYTTAAGNGHDEHLTGSSLNKSKVEENRQFVKQLFSKSPSNHLQQFVPPPSTVVYNTNPKLSPYKKTVGKAVRNLQNPPSFSSWKAKTSDTGKSSTVNLKFPCTKCSTICHSPQEMFIHFSTQCNGLLGGVGILPEKTRRIGIEARNCYIQPLDFEASRHARFPEKFKIANSSNHSAANENVHHSDDYTAVNVNGNVDADENMDCDGQDGEIEKFVAKNLPLVEPNYNGDVKGELATLFEHEGDQDLDSVSNLTDSGVSSVTGTSDDHPGQNGESKSPSLDSVFPVLNNVPVKSKRKSKAKGIDDRVLVPKNKNLKHSPNRNNIEAPQALKRTSVRNLQKSKPTISAVPIKKK